MNDNRTTLEVIAPTIEEAVDKGLTELGLTKDDVEVEVLDEGKRNLFRFASRQARIRLIVKGEDYVKPEVDEPIVEAFENDLEMDEKAQPAAVSAEGMGEFEEVVSQTVRELLDKMGVKAEFTVETVYSEAEERDLVFVNILGDDLSYLIGRRSETLNALQYITSLIVNHKLNRWIPIQVDVQNYRARRENELKKIARRIATQVASSGKKQFLEPMTASERRIIHIELRDDPTVFTESVGEEPNRKVSILPNPKEE